ncbi:unnamed protein product [Sympodiomycopsis kandeliae]
MPRFLRTVVSDRITQSSFRMGRGGNGRGRGGRGRGRGGFHPFSGVGQVLGGSAGQVSSSDESQYLARGFSSLNKSTTKPGRGGSLSARGQNAVPFDYSRLSNSSTPDISTSAPGSGSEDRIMVPRTPLVPRADSSSSQRSTPAIGRSPFAKGRYVKEPEYPAYYTSRGNAQDGGSRPPEAQGDSKYLAAVPGSSSSRFNKPRKQSRFGDPADRNPHLMPVSFVAASGEWKDGKWTGKPPTKDDDAKLTEGTQSRFDAINSRPSGAGLGFASKAPRAQELSQDDDDDDGDDDENDQEESESQEESIVDQMAALLQEFPGSEELQGAGEHGLGDIKTGFPTFEASSSSIPIQHSQQDRKEPHLQSSSSSALVSPAPAPIPAQHSIAAPQHPSRPMETIMAEAAKPTSQPPTQPRPAMPSSDEDDEMIVIGQQNNAAQPQGDLTQLTAQSDSEEERQLDAIIAAAAAATSTKPLEAGKPASPSPAPFVFDFSGEDPSSQTASRHDPRSNAYVLGDEQAWEDALTKHGVGGSSTTAPVDPMDADPRADYSQVMDESSEEEFVPLSGAKASARNPGTGRKARIAAKKARRKARKAGHFVEDDDDDDDEEEHSSRKQDRKEPRMGDSDLEWGSDGPPDVSLSSRERRRLEKSKENPPTKSSGHRLGGDTELDIRQLSLNTGRQDLPQTRADEERMLQEALALSTATSHSQSQPRSGVSFSSICVKSGNKRQTDQEAILADYMENALRRQQSDSEEEDVGKGKGMRIVEDHDSEADETANANEMDAMIKFMKGMDGQQGGRQMTLGDIEDEQKMNEEDEWMTESGEDDDESEDEQVQAGSAQSSKSKKTKSDLDAALDASERQEIGESDLEEASEAEEDESDDGYDDEESDVIYDSDQDEDEDSDLDSEEDEGGVFDRNFTWAAEDEQFINNIERFARANDHILRGNDRQARNKLFKAIELGDFGEYEGTSATDLADMLDIEEADLAGTRPAAKKGKKAAKDKQPWSDDTIWAEKLQSQWEKDRATKAANKRKRAEERRAALQNPYPSSNIKKGTKKMAKKAARAARRAAVRTDDEAVDEWDPVGSRGGKDLLGNIGQATNLRQLDVQILSFLDDDGHTTMSLPPMEKRARAQVHMLADAYSIKSKSRGTGRSRFITLFKTKHSGLQVNTRKIQQIIAGRGDASFGVKAGGKKGKGSGGAKSGGGQAGSFVAPNKDGAEVGFGADKIGSDNIGHRLLSAMGWSEGMGVGASGVGMSDPVNATIKTSKGGLGF